MNLRLSPRHLLFALLATGTVLAGPVQSVDIYKSATCGCCGQWAEHMRKSGFKVKQYNVDDVPTARRKLGMPDRLGSCHTARIGKYLIEGHVPAGDVQRLLKEQPDAIGLAVPSMPPGAPGMDIPNSPPYETLLVQADGSTRVFAKH